MYSEYADLNKEGFMNILAKIWDQCARPERICKAGKRVGVSKDGLSVKWMDKNKFKQAANEFEYDKKVTEQKAE